MEAQLQSGDSRLSEAFSASVLFRPSTLDLQVLASLVPGEASDEHSIPAVQPTKAPVQLDPSPAVQQ